MAYLIGLISNDERQLLHAIRKIRNDFGHSSQPRSFQVEPIKSRCMSITVYPQVFERVTGIPFESSNPEHRFRSTTLFLTLAIGKRFQQMRRASEAEPITETSVIGSVPVDPHRDRR